MMKTSGLSEKTVLGFKIRSVHVGFVVDKVALGHIYLRALLRFLPPCIIPALLSTNPTICNLCGRIVTVYCVVE
jgi:hypothetical protein